MKFKTFLLLILLSVSAAVYADSRYSNDCCDYNTCCYDPCDSCFDFSVEVDWIFWNPRRCGLDYAWPQEDSEVLGPGTAETICPSYHSGFRIGAFTESCDWEFGVRYTRLSSDDSEQVSPSGDFDLVVSRGHPEFTRNDWGEVIDPDGFAYSRYCVDYNLVELESRYNWDLKCSGSIGVLFGVNLTFLNQELNSTYSPDGNEIVIDGREVFEKNDINAYGFYIGFDGNYNICGDFGLFGRATTGVAVATVDRSLDDLIYDEGLDETIHIKECCSTHVNYTEIQAGFQYEFCGFCDSTITLRAGYEFRNWSNLPDFLNFQEHDAEDESVGYNARNGHNFGFDGLFIGLSAAF